jgi:Raf kinase inhibitor-like YbhB/YbcL family protein
VHDPDAPLIGGFTHWTLWDIPADETSLNEDPAGYTTGSNGMGAPGWVPPSPPPGHGNHFYYFHVYALDAPLGLEPGADLDAFHAAVEDHVIAQARVVGTCGSD